MKKIIIAVALIVLVVGAYLGQVAYMRTLNQKLFELSSQENDFVSIEDMDFQKGFFSSKANFLLYIKTEATDLVSLGLGQMPISVEIRFKNNIFAKDNVNVNFENPLYELMKGSFDGEMSMDKIFLNIKASISLFGNVKLTSKFTDIDIQQDDFLIKLNNFLVESKMDVSGKFYGSKLNLDEFALSFPSYSGMENFSIKNLHVEEFLDKGVDYTEYLGQAFVAGKAKASIEQMQIYDFNFLNIESNSQSSSSKNGLVKASIDTTIKSIASPLMQIKLDDLSSNLEMNNVAWEVLMDSENLSNEIIDSQEFALNFFSSFPSIELKSLNFSSNGRKITSKGDLRGSPKEYNATFFIESEAVPSEIFPPLQFLGINELFVEKEGKYILDFAFHSNYKDTKMALNGEDISSENDAIINVD